MLPATLITTLRVLLLLLTGLTPVAFADVEITSGFQYDALGDDMVYFETGTADASLDAAQLYAGDWLTPPKNPPNFGFSKSGYWFKTTAHNRTPEIQHLILSIDYPMLDQLEVYQLVHGKLLSHHALGDLKAFASRPISNRNFLIPLTFAPQSSHELYIFIRTNSSVQLPIALWNKEIFYQRDIEQSLGLGLYFGFITIMVIYNLFLYFTIKETSYLFYVIYVSGWCLFQACMSGHAYQYLWPESPRWNDIALPVTVFATNLGGASFAIYFLSLKKSSPYAYRLSMGIAGLSTLMLIACFVMSYAITIRIGAAFTVFSTIAMMIIGIRLWRKGLKHARFYAIGWSAFLFGSALLSLTVLGVLPMTFVTEHSGKIGSVIEVVLLSFALADRFNMERAEKQIAQQKMEAMRFEIYKEGFRQKEQAVAAEAAIRAKDEFLSTMSHEIRTPMNGVVGVLQLFQDTPLDAQQKELLRIMNGSAQTLLSIINDILDFSKIQAGKMHIESIPFNLRDLLDDIASLYSMTTKLNDETEFKLIISPDVSTWVVGDPVRLKQILTNYLNNAVKFTPKGHITLRVARDDNQRIRFAVEDSGIGISEAGLAKLFQGFSQTSADTARKYGGTGLGLSICKKLSELMGGEVGASSCLGEGSTFWCSVLLPACEAPTAVEKRDTRSVAALQQVRVLLAEDNSVNQFVARNMLKKLGINHVDCAENGEEALALYQTNAYDLILMDCQMPVKDGYETTAAIRSLESSQQKPRIPIAALTASATQEEQQQCLACGMDIHIAKPLRLNDLETAIHFLLKPAAAA